MVTYVCLLRGINNVGSRRVKMGDLRALFAAEGAEGARTYLQSGNIVFRHRHQPARALAAKIEAAIEAEFGFATAAILRTAPELRAALAANPFARRSGLDNSRLLVTFLDARPQSRALQRTAAMQYAPDEFVIVGREIYAYMPNGVANAQLPWSNLAKLLGQTGTARNWNTVTAVAALAAEIEIAAR